MQPSLNRRKFLQVGLGSTATLAALSGFGTKALAAAGCGLTPPQTPGPFYPGEASFKPENDLTSIPGRPRRAEGQVDYVKGRVVDQLCRPVKNANVEIWQACASGRYNNPKDPNTAPLDPNFRYWGETHTDTKGEYIFKTIIPGAYPADTDWVRPPHIHFKVSRLGYKELVTQMYFKGETLNDKDLILLDIAPGERERVIVEFRDSPSGLEPKTLFGEFEISLQSVRG
jgi:protocatechuate 3,4-dioxygenase beta subunit